MTQKLKYSLPIHLEKKKEKKLKVLSGLAFSLQHELETLPEFSLEQLDDETYETIIAAKFKLYEVDKIFKDMGLIAKLYKEEGEVFGEVKDDSSMDEEYEKLVEEMVDELVELDASCKSDNSEIDIK